jgi:hypothetical protein
MLALGSTPQAVRGCDFVAAAPGVYPWWCSRRTPILCDSKEKEAEKKGRAESQEMEGGSRRVGLKKTVDSMVYTASLLC